MSNGSKRCSRCGEVKTLDRFHGHWRSKDGRTSACKDCRGEWTPEKDRESKRRWREQNPDKQREAQRRYVEQNLEKVSGAKSRYSLENIERVREAKRQWSLRNVAREREKTQRRRARLRGASVHLVSPKDLRRLMRSACIACGGEADSLDHLIPLYRGGLHGVGNLAPMCGMCNSRKGAKTMTEWRKANDWLPLGSFPRRKDRADGAA